MEALDVGGSMSIHEDWAPTANLIATHLAPKTFSVAFSYTAYNNSYTPLNTCVYAQVWSVTRTA